MYIHPFNSRLPLLQHYAFFALLTLTCLAPSWGAGAQPSTPVPGVTSPTAYANSISYSTIQQYVDAHNFPADVGPDFAATWKAVTDQPHDLVAWTKLAALLFERADDIRWERTPGAMTSIESDQCSRLGTLEYYADRMRVQLSPSSSEAWVILAKAAFYGMDSNPVEGTYALHEALSLDPNNDDAISTGLNFYQPMWYDDPTRLTAFRAMALKHFNTASMLVPQFFDPVGPPPTDDPVLRQLSEAATAAVPKIDPTDPKNADIEEQMATVYWNTSKFTSAEAAFRACIADNPGSGDFHYEFARFLQTLNRNTEAMAEFHAALNDDPYSAETLYELSKCTPGPLGSDDRLKLLQNVVSLDPGCARAWYDLGAVLFDQHKVEDAKAAYTKAAAVDSEGAQCRTEALARLASPDFDTTAAVAAGQTPMMTAAIDDQLDTVKKLIAQGADINAAGPNDATPIWEAVTHHAPDVATYLAQHGAKIDDVYDDGSLVGVAAYNQDEPTALAMVAAGVPLTIVGRNNETALHYAAYRGEDLLVAAIIAKGANLSPKEASGWTPLGTSAYWNNIGCLKLLIQAGVDVNERNNDGTTAAICAAKNGNLEMLKLLVDHGADLTLADQSNKETPIIKAAEGSNTDIVDYLLAHGATVNEHDTNDTTVVMFAAYWGQTDMIKHLVALGADINHKNKVGDTALKQAKAQGHQDTVDLLTSLGEKE